jgi:hypothetical protein
MAERPNAPVLKTGVGKPTVGSNPTLSAKTECSSVGRTALSYGACRRFESFHSDKQAVCLQQCRHPIPRIGLSQPVRADWCRARSTLGREAREVPSSVCNVNTGTQSPKHHDHSGVLTSKARKAKRRTVLPVFTSGMMAEWLKALVC